MTLSVSSWVLGMYVLNNGVVFQVLPVAHSVLLYPPVFSAAHTLSETD